MAAKNDVKSTPPLTEAHQIRVDLLKLTHRHDRSAADAVKKAQEYEQYVTGVAKIVEENPTDEVTSNGQDEPDIPV